MTSDLDRILDEHPHGTLREAEDVAWLLLERIILRAAEDTQ